MKYLHGQSIEMEKSYRNLTFDRHTYTFVSLLDYFRSKELYCDATIACDGTKYPVHQVVLSACSEFFANIFASTSCQNPVVVLQDVSKSHLESLLTYVYRGEVNVPQNEFPDFVKVAKSLYIKGLMIPYNEQYSSPEPINGTWHDSYYSSEEEAARSRAARRDFHGQVSVMPQMSPREELAGLPSYHAHMQRQASSSRVNDHHSLKSQRQMEHEQYVRHNGRHLKRTHYMMDRPQDLRIPELPHQRHETGNKISDEHLANSRISAEHLANSRISAEHLANSRISAEHLANSRISAEHLANSRVSAEHLANSRISAEHLANSRISDEQLTNNQRSWKDNEDPSKYTGDSNLRNRKRLKSSETNEQLDDERSKRNNYCHTEPQGTFQELITADETPIKKEPEDPVIECDTKPICPLEEIKDPQDDDDEAEEAPLQISEDLGDIPDVLVTDSGINGHAEPDDPKEYSPNPEHQSRSDTTTPQGQLSPSSHLRRELLRPIHQGVGHIPHHPQGTPHSIPHPVIAPRNPQLVLKPKPQLQPQPPLREPPPLMKIQPKMPPSLISEGESNRGVPRGMMKDMPGNRSNNHLLVSAPPTYHSHTNPSHQLCFEIHNQQLGPVLVNGGPHINLSAPMFSQPKPQSHSNNENNNINNMKLTSDSIEAPLNLSGGQRSSPEILDETDDPFLGKIVTNRKKRLRGPKSWEFLVRLLKDPTTNPALIRWENESNGVFRLVQPSVIAKRWGRRTGKHASECLTYENFARGLRYHYATGALRPVSEKSFVYQFGPKALALLHECDSSAFPYI